LGVHGHPLPCAHDNRQNNNDSTILSSAACDNKKQQDEHSKMLTNLDQKSYVIGAPDNIAETEAEEITSQLFTVEKVKANSTIRRTLNG
jgi:hypothetical protein